MTEAPVRHRDTIIFPASLDPKAVTVVERLTEAGYESYLVGGCVRDLLLGHIPKDFDVSTAARPRQIRRVFRNCRVIGRRFKLAHVHFGKQIIEVATFRRNPEDGELESADEGDGEADSDDLLIVRDNVFGTAEEDARRRDFTMNALLYDVGRAEVHDWVGGFEDLQARVLRTIGEPEVRLAEDPVRMLRAIKFTARLSLTLDPALDAAIHACADQIEKSAPPRVLEEIYKLLSCGKAERSLAMLLDYGLLSRLLPDVGSYWEEHRERLVALGRALDLLDRGQRRLSNALMLSVLYHDPWREQVEQAEGSDPMALARDLIAPAAVSMSVPRRDVGRLKGLLTTQLRLERPKRGRRMRMTEFLGRAAVQEAIQFQYLRCLAGGADPEIHAAWAERLAWHLGEAGRDEARDEEEPAREGRSRRRRRRGGRHGRRGRRDDDRKDGGRRDDGATGGEGRRRSPARTASEDETKAPAPEHGETSAVRARGVDAAPAADTSPSPEAAVEASGGSGVQDTPTEAGKRGLKGLVGRLVRKVLRQEDAPASDEAPPSQPPERPAAAARAPATGSPPAAADDEPGAAAADAAPEASSETDHPRDDQAPRPKRKRRRRRRRSKGGGAARAPEDQDAEPSAETTSDDHEAKAADESASSEAGGSRSRRRRSRSKGGKGGGERSGSKGSSRARSNGSGEPRKGSGRGKSGSRSKSKSSKPKSTSKSSARPHSKSKSKPKSESDQATGPSQRHPEDVEDIFDW